MLVGGCDCSGLEPEYGTRRVVGVQSVALEGGISFAFAQAVAFTTDNDFRQATTVVIHGAQEPTLRHVVSNHNKEPLSGP
jgi:hypothetical protein